MNASVAVVNILIEFLANYNENAATYMKYNYSECTEHEKDT